MDIIKSKTQKAVAHAQRAPQLFGFGLFIASTYLAVAEENKKLKAIILVFVIVKP